MSGDGWVCVCGGGVQAVQTSKVSEMHIIPPAALKSNYATIVCGLGRGGEIPRIHFDCTVREDRNDRRSANCGKSVQLTDFISAICWLAGETAGGVPQTSSSASQQSFHLLIFYFFPLHISLESKRFPDTVAAAGCILAT